MKKSLRSRIIFLLTAVAVILSLSAQFSTASADQTISLISVMKASGSNTFYVKFSAPVHIYENGYVWLRPDNCTGSDGQTNPSSIVYSGADKTVVGQNEFSSELTLVFPSISFTNYGFTIVEYFKNDTNAGYISPLVIAGENGEKVCGNTVSGGIDFLWIPCDAADTANNFPIHVTDHDDGSVKLVSAVKRADGYVFDLTFSKPVHIFRSDYFWLRKADAANSTQSSSKSVEYTGDVTVKDEGKYSKTVAVTFNAPTFTDYGISIVEYFLNDTNDGMVSPLVIAGENGEMLSANFKNGENLDFLWVPCDAADTANKYPLHITTNIASELVDARKGFDGYVYTLTFSSPVHFFKNGYVWIRPDDPQGWKGQVNPTKIEYVGDDAVISGGNQYSSVVRLHFPEPVDMESDKFGVSIVEYGLANSTDAGYISPSVVAAIDGGRVKCNFTSSENLDFLWIPCDAADTANKYAIHLKTVGIDILYAALADDCVSVAFDRSVNITDTGKIHFYDSNDKELQKDSFGFFPSSATSARMIRVVISGGTAAYIRIEDGALTDSEGCGIEKSADGSYYAKLSDIAYRKGKALSVKDGGKYTFMNCDTGRSLSYNGITEFTVKAVDKANNFFALYIEGEAIDISGCGTSEIGFFTDNDYDRIQLRVNYMTQVLADDDKGSDAAASAATVPASYDDLNTGWYITEVGDVLPVKYAVYGDSISYGVNPDETGNAYGCRKELAEKMLAIAGRAVAVGSVAGSSSIYDGYMLRHEGHPGWVVQAQKAYEKNPANNYGIDTLRENLQTKYAPDTIFMMIGINDCGQLGYNEIYNDTNGVRTALVERWTVLVDAILSDLPEDGNLVVASCTPLAASASSWNDTYNTYVGAYNSAIVAKVTEYNEKGERRIVFADNFGYVFSAGTDAISSDRLHLSAKGYSAMAQSYADTFDEHYRLFGDADNNGTVDGLDLIVFAKYNLELIGKSECALKNMDVNRDGAVDGLDLIVMAKYNLELIDSLPLIAECSKGQFCEITTTECGE